MINNYKKPRVYAQAKTYRPIMCDLEVDTFDGKRYDRLAIIQIHFLGYNQQDLGQVTSEALVKEKLFNLRVPEIEQLHLLNGRFRID